MKLSPDCRQCLLSKVASEGSTVVQDPAILDTIVAACAAIYDEGKRNDEGAAVVAGRIHRFCYEASHTEDLFLAVKDHDNERAAAILTQVAPRIATLHDAMTAAVLGNAIDYGVTGHTVTDDLSTLITTGLAQKLAIDDSAAMMNIADRIVYFTDNCGEVVFDMRFIEALKKHGSHVTVVVKGRPMLNDVTMREARICGLDAVADDLYAGSTEQLLGTHPPYFPPEVTAAVSSATLIIAKGLANYESLTEYPITVPVAYLMMVKCAAVARHLSENYGCTVAKGDLVAILDRKYAT